MRRIRVLRATVGVLVLGTTMLTLGTAAAAPNSSPANKGPARPPAQPQAEECDLRASHRSVHDEWAHCLSVTATLSRAPAVGQTATLSLEVRADATRRGARITIELPANLAFVEAPAGAVQTSGRSSSGVGSARRATTTADLAAGSVHRLSARIRAIAAGPAHIRARTLAAIPGGSDGAADDVFLTVGSSSAESRFGFATSTVGGVVQARGRTAPSAPPRRTPSAPVDELPQPHSDDPRRPGPSATSCASGSWHFLDENGVLRPSVNYQVQVWDDDSSSGDDQLISGVTSFSGTYNLCFNGTDGEGGGQEVFVRFVSSNSQWRVRDTPGGNNDYVNSTGVQAICDGCSHSFGGLMPGNDIHRGMNAFDAANDAWVWVPSDCWDANDGTCRQVVINWTATSTDGTFYSRAGNDVHLAADDPNAPTVVIHEIGHAVMDDVYEDAMPPNPNCSNHPIRGVTSTGCAWTEGFAEWFPAGVLNDPFFRWPDGSSLDLENNTWGTPDWSNGDAVEGRVAGAMIDISDFTNEAFWDRYGEGDPGNIWTTFLNNVSNTFLEFWQHRAAGGFNTANDGANGSVYQSTIDYTFRDPLANYVELTRPTPTPHNYSYNTGSVYWSVVAVRPPLGNDYDLTLYDDVGQTAPIGSSGFGGSTIDFVAVDSNHRPLGDYAPRVYLFSGPGGNYQVELAQGTNQLNLGSQVVAMGTNDVVQVRDSSLTVGVPTFFRVAPSNGAQDPELFLMQSDPANSATWVRGRGSAVASSTSSGVGAAEGFSFTPAATDWFGLVLINRAGSGDYTLNVDTSAPTGTVSINGGAAATNSTAATATLSAGDSHTGVEAMRISTDGAMDAEPFVAYTATQPVTLPGGDGAKTVLAQFRNGAGMTSEVVSDTILMDTVVPVSTDPVVSVPINSILNGVNAQVRATWSASDTGSGVASHQLQLSTDGGGSWTDLTLPLPTSTQRGVNLARGNTLYAFRTRALDAAGNPGAYTTSPVFKVLVHQEDANLVTLTSGWTIEADPNADAGDLASTSLAGQKATFSTVDARTLAVVARKGPNAGKMNVFLDGVKVKGVDLYSPTVQDRVVVCTTPVTPGVPHTLEIRSQAGKNPASTGTVVTLDAIVRLQ